ncbi:hypothetical protein LINGRAHAP2_LOCUS21976 [Linum grandiflorum]
MDASRANEDNLDVGAPTYSDPSEISNCDLVTLEELNLAITQVQNQSKIVGVTRGVRLALEKLKMEFQIMCAAKYSSAGSIECLLYTCKPHTT